MQPITISILKTIFRSVCVLAVYIIVLRISSSYSSSGYSTGIWSVLPLPLSYLRKIETVSSDILIVFYQRVAHLLEQVCTTVSELRKMIYHIHYEMESVYLILNPHIERRCDRTLFKISVYA